MRGLIRQSHRPGPNWTRRWAKDGIHGYAVHPGIIPGPSLNSSVGEEQLRATGLIDRNGQPVVDPDRGIKNPQQGASTTVFAATSPMLERIGGVYLLDNDTSALDEDPRSAQRLWELSEALIKT
ncbi:hypothetical protein B7755_040575 [Streptomyces sp. NBS 14/10]|uniref:hypothetical protein n=1 Tax=Streptomyces sp. NBS 14/10 TaxID=1945643 RepID=UPI000B802B94|nr:hypothetical protein [Streptomyces sp. NBS 14/10]KAK1183857.1 hypothetical protein B7755_040575 [Streptomyces sp. NBS 14/10]